MADIKTKDARSKNMSAIKSKETKPEIYLRKLLFSRGYRYRKNVSYIFGHPDIYLGKYKTAIFVHGCFWHRHQKCKFAYSPKSNVEFWEKKFERNIIRDKVVSQTLFDTNIKCLIVWECTIKKMKKDIKMESEILEKIICFLENELLYMEL
ncbi:very short patch repair endonuclease [Enterocloster clostridioformis]|uniref:Very short patch repair endonuclease n=1 Tax=Enterocloster clostridioformis TaxID=1531 RepID=A0A1I0IV07_9FIRM|nr:very short patch repair endonuclease [Enterocloster clostridioformis]SEU01165.1 T/G mismatch-specific endonuclease [Enterocloster clostridioformis]SEW41614.1 T/G mismatch-specific endonuclease [Enterocloster clostridioformis]